MVAYHSGFPNTKHLCNIPTGSTLTEALYTSGVCLVNKAVHKFRDFRPISGYMWETIQNRAIATMKR